MESHHARINLEPPKLCLERNSRGGLGARTKSSMKHLQEEPIFVPWFQRFCPPPLEGLTPDAMQKDPAQSLALFIGCHA
jgi:hypothetical protein